MNSTIAEEMNKDVEKSSFHQKYIDRKNNLLKGKIWAVKGKIYTKDSAITIPTITIEKEIKEVTITKNGKVVTEHTFEVTEKDDLSIEVKDMVTPHKATIITDEDRLTAFVEIEPGYRIVRKLKKIPPTHAAMLTIEERKEVYTKASIEEIKGKLREAGITFGIKEEAIVLAAQATKHAMIEVAKGIPPQEGNDGFLELKVDPSIKRTLDVDEKGNIDFRENRRIPTIEPEDILAIIHPPKAGKSGRSVVNEEIQPTPTKAIRFYPGKGTVLKENEIIATRVGRPDIHQKDHIVKATVIPKFLQKENVNIATGNIRFYGDVEVVGEIEENMVVEAGNDFILHGSVNRSSITATHSIVCRGNIANSILSAGEKHSVLLTLAQSVEKITNQFETLVAVVVQVTQSSSYQNSETKQSIRTLLDFLLEKRFTDFKDDIKKYILNVEQNNEFLPQEWKNIAKKLQELFFSRNHIDTTIIQLKIVLNSLHRTQEESSIDLDEDSSISVESTINSTLKCSGDIQVVGHGSLNTIIEAQGKVTVNGLLRGSSVFAKEGAEIRETGSTGGVRTSISVPEDKKIQIIRAYEGTELKIGLVRLVLNEVQHNVSAHLNSKGEIVLK